MADESSKKLRPVQDAKSTKKKLWQEHIKRLAESTRLALIDVWQRIFLMEVVPKFRDAFQSPGGWRMAVPGLPAAAVAVALAVDLLVNAATGVIIGSVMLALLSLRLIYALWFRRLPVFDNRLSGQQLLFLICLSILLAGLSRGFDLIALAMSGNGAMALSAVGFAVPLATGPMLVSLFMGRQAGMLYALATALLACLIWPNSVALFVFYLLSGVVAAHYVRSGRTRLSLIGAGAWSALIGVLTIVALALFQGWLASSMFMAATGAAVIGLLLSGMLAAGLAPLAENSFGFISAPHLMELASMDHPLLQELMLQAPGTYHHSLVISSMVEAAAKAIGADSLLAKVAALYHDLGKVKKCDYFIENQSIGPNKHEKLAPSMSALILASHVKEGVEAARKHRLGQPIVDIIAQHHGTRLIHFFYNKAQEAAREAGRDEPDAEAFRYPGPRPQTREAGLIMLADTVEAASRTLENPTPARLQGVVQSQINKVFAEGQLDECELTLKDLHKIAKIFNKSLTGIFHHRVDYPKTENGSAKQSGTGDRQSSRSGADRPSEAGSQDQKDLKRLGIG